jgi:O-antigen/teichoic acid export membrane protein
MPTIEQEGMREGSVIRAAYHARRQRTNRIRLAWGTSLVSTITTIGVQLLAVPLVYRALGQTAYAAYTAVTAAAGLIGILNLGIGGSLVRPIAAAAVEGNTRLQAMLVYAGLMPLIVLCLIGAAGVIPAVSLLPLTLLFGKLGTVNPVASLRAASLIAVLAALIAVPLSATDVLRQAFQEMHVSNLFGAAANVLMCLALLIAAYHSKSLAVFVAAFTLPPLMVRVANCSVLFAQRPYLLQRSGRFPWLESRTLLGDGMRYLSSSFSYVLVYQWPVYWIARALPAGESVPFAISMQVVLLAVSFTLGFLRPLWSSTADAQLRGDHAWLDKQIRAGRRTIVLAGAVVLATMLLLGQTLVRLWIRQPITLGWQVRGLIGALILLAIWEQFYFLLALGLGHLKQATTAIFQRAAAFALSVPLLAALGGPKALWCGMCCSILFWTAWRLPRLLHRAPL